MWLLFYCVPGEDSIYVHVWDINICSDIAMNWLVKTYTPKSNSWLRPCLWGIFSKLSSYREIGTPRTDPSLTHLFEAKIVWCTLSNWEIGLSPSPQEIKRYFFSSPGGAARPIILNLVGIAVSCDTDFVFTNFVIFDLFFFLQMLPENQRNPINFNFNT